MMHTDAPYGPWLRTRVLPEGVSLQVLNTDGDVLFCSRAKWLHPLLEVERFVQEQHLDPTTLVLHDRIAGRAAAALSVHIGFRTVRLSLMSRLAEQVYRRHGIIYFADTVVDRIACRTEDIIDDTMDLTRIHAMIVERAARSRTDS